MIFRIHSTFFLLTVLGSSGRQLGQKKGDVFYAEFFGGTT
jgi:hypothetical protein